MEIEKEIVSDYVTYSPALNFIVLSERIRGISGFAARFVFVLPLLCGNVDGLIESVFHWME